MSTSRPVVDKSRMNLDKEGKQSYLSSKLTPKELHQKISKPNLDVEGVLARAGERG